MSSESLFPHASGQVAALARATDWPRTGLGPPATWPAQFRSAFEVILETPYAMSVIGPGMHLLYNDAYIRMLGDRHPAAFARPMSEVWQEIWPQLEPAIADAFAGSPALFEDAELALSKDGVAKRHWFTYSLSPIRDAGGRIVGVLNVCSETTIAVERGQALSAERDSLWEVSQDISVVIDAHGGFRAVNPATTRVLGWLPEEMIGRTVFDFVLEADDEPTADALAQAGNAAMPTFVNRYRHKDGSLRWLSWTAAPKDDLIFATARDITAERAAAAELAVAQAALRQSQKMEALGQLTGGIAHDFNNMLAGILGAIEMSRRRLAAGSTGDVDKLLGRAVTSSQRAAALTQRLLAFARRQPLTIEVIDVGTLLRSLQELLVHSLGPGIALSVVVAPELWQARIDAAQLESALLNLAVNARDAMGGSGRLVIEARNGAIDAAYADSHAEVQAGDYVIVSVTDDGAGMSPGVLAKAFDPFYTTKPIGQGTGLGLSMIYGFMKQAGGHVRLHSQLGLGTTATLYLPREGLAAQDEASTVAAAPSEGETILLVEDDPDLREVQQFVLADLGYEFAVAPDGPSAIAILASGRHVDLLVTDVGLPGMNGRQLAEIARGMRPELPVLFVTGYAEQAALNPGVLAKGMRMITKPVPVEEFATALREMLDARAVAAR